MNSRLLLLPLPLLFAVCFNLANSAVSPSRKHNLQAHSNTKQFVHKHSSEHQSTLISLIKTANAHNTFVNALQFARGKRSTRQVSPDSGYTFDSCRFNGQCQAPRACADMTMIPRQLCRGSRFCACFPPRVAKCTTSDDCEENEGCIQDLTLERTCVSRKAAAAIEYPLIPGVSDLLASPSPFITPAPVACRGGLTFDHCTANSDCKGIRVCASLSLFGQCGEEGACICDMDWRLCTQSRQCECGEVCVRNFDRISFCLSRQAAISRAIPFIEDSVDATPTQISPTSTPSASLELFPSVDPTDITPTSAATPSYLSQSSLPQQATPSLAGGSQIPYPARTNPALIPIPEGLVPSTTPTPFSTPSASAVYPHVSASQLAPSFTAVPPRVASETPQPSTTTAEISASANIEEVSPSPEETSELTCIGADSLQDVPQHRLVYKRHQIAHVVCDMNNSCATGGHMVIFDGKAMMMSTYCDLVVCEKRIMYVNSPKWGRKVMIDSKTEGLQFTAFAARYNTVTEERVLSTLVRMGL